jgi:hypothetical protein
VIADVASAGIPRDGDLRPAYGIFTYTPRGWRVQIRRVRYQVRKATQAISARKVPGAPLLIHKLVEAKYRHHQQLLEAARRHSGLPPSGYSHGPHYGSGSHAPGGVQRAVQGAPPLHPADVGLAPPSPEEMEAEPEDSIADGRPLALVSNGGSSSDE